MNARATALGVVILGAGIALGFFAGRQSVPRKVPETAAAASLRCADAEDEFCRLKLENYKRAWRIGEVLAERNCLVATAESITAGNFAGTFGKVKWAGLVLAGGVTSYNTSVKNALLNVRETTDKGVISEDTAREMVEGLRSLFTPVNDWQGRRKQGRRVCLYIAFTGAALRWGDIEPRVHIGIAQTDQAVHVQTFSLKPGLAPKNYARRYNVELAIAHGLALMA